MTSAWMTSAWMTSAWMTSALFSPCARPDYDINVVLEESRDRLVRSLAGTQSQNLRKSLTHYRSGQGQGRFITDSSQPPDSRAQLETHIPPGSPSQNERSGGRKMDWAAGLHPSAQMVAMWKGNVHGGVDFPPFPEIHVARDHYSAVVSCFHWRTPRQCSAKAQARGSHVGGLTLASTTRGSSY
jgi:hypothetical protein